MLHPPPTPPPTPTPPTPTPTPTPKQPTDPPETLMLPQRHSKCFHVYVAQQYSKCFHQVLLAARVLLVGSDAV